MRYIRVTDCIRFDISSFRFYFIPSFLVVVAVVVAILFVCLRSLYVSKSIKNELKFSFRILMEINMRDLTLKNQFVSDIYFTYRFLYALKQAGNII